MHFRPCLRASFSQLPYPPVGWSERYEVRLPFFTVVLSGFEVDAETWCRVVVVVSTGKAQCAEITGTFCVVTGEVLGCSSAGCCGSSTSRLWFDIGGGVVTPSILSFT